MYKSHNYLPRGLTETKALSCRSMAHPSYLSWQGEFHNYTQFCLSSCHDFGGRRCFSNSLSTRVFRMYCEATFCGMWKKHVHSKTANSCEATFCIWLYIQLRNVQPFMALINVVFVTPSHSDSSSGSSSASTNCKNTSSAARVSMAWRRRFWKWYARTCVANFSSASCHDCEVMRVQCLIRTLVFCSLLEALQYRLMISVIWLPYSKFTSLALMRMVAIARKKCLSVAKFEHSSIVLSNSNDIAL